tara:strand:+ start:1869 stop:3071 length:1203 start_codon:yes stop_codon:yes gene_type:complete
MKINRIGKNLAVVLTDGTLLSHSKCDDELYMQVINYSIENSEEKIRTLLTPKLEVLKKEVADNVNAFQTLAKSKILTIFGNSVYLEKISQLTLPFDLACAIYHAEEAGDTELIETYCNFWTLCCLNPDSRARTNLFWFLDRYGMTISKSGLFIAYRNVELKKEGVEIDSAKTNAISEEYVKLKFKHKKSPKNFSLYYDYDVEPKEYKSVENKKISSEKFQEKTNVVVGNLEDLYHKLKDGEEGGATVYTDQRTKKMEISLGKPVTLARDKCDAKQENTCSSGLHVAGKKWLKKNSFGNISILCLVNPADVVAVPPSDNYGKMRVCSYFPVKVISGDLQTSVQDYPDGFEDDFMSLIAYDGEFSTDQSFEYTLKIPEIPEISRRNILDQLQKISKNLKKVV